MVGGPPKSGKIFGFKQVLPDRFFKSFLFFLSFFFLTFIWLHQVFIASSGIFVVAHGLPSCGTQAPECVGLVAPRQVGS